MAQTTDIYFSQVLYNDDGVKRGETTIMETLVIDWDEMKYKFRAGDAAHRYGYGNSQPEAILDYLRMRLGLVMNTRPVRYSNRVY